jgi:anti-sigma B factor antagonist
VSIDVRTESIDDGFVVAPEGEVDLSNSRELQHQLRQMLGKSPNKLVVDLAGVPYMDSSGVATLVEAMQLARKNQTSLVLCGMKDKVRSIFEIARLDKVFTIVDSRDAAVSM